MLSAREIKKGKKLFNKQSQVMIYLCKHKLSSIYEKEKLVRKWLRVLTNGSLNNIRQRQIGSIQYGKPQSKYGIKILQLLCHFPTHIILYPAQKVF